MTGPERHAALLGRVLLCLIFLWSGLGKLLAPAATIAYIAKAGLPVPVAAYGVSLCAELGCALLVLVGLWTRPAAGVLCLFCLATGLAVHGAADHGAQIQLMKNVCMAGGFLYVLAAGPGALSLDALRGRRTVVAAG